MARTTDEKKSENVNIPISPRLKNKLFKISKLRSRDADKPVLHTAVAREYLERCAEQELAAAGK